MGKLLSFFLLIIIGHASITQASDIHLAKDLNKINMKEQTTDIQRTVLQSHCDECQDCDEGDCSQSGHCRHSCSFHVYLSDNAFKMNIPVYSYSMLKWFYDGHYISPFLDPGLRPPLFS